MSYDVLPIDVNGLKKIYETAYATDSDNMHQVEYLLGVIEGVLGSFFTVTTAASSDPEANSEEKRTPNNPPKEENKAV